MKQTLFIKNELTLDLIEKLVYGDYQISLDKECLRQVDKAADYIKKKAENGEVIYGVTTGFGANSHRVINPKDAGKLQKNLLISHATGVGDPFPREVTRLAVILRIVNFLHGHSGVRREIVERLAIMYNKDIIPLVPSQGSVGASGDLAPLSHIGITLLGEGKVFYQGKKMSTQDALKIAGLEPIELTYKEGLALNNGTTFMEAQGLVNLIQSKKIALLADMIAGVTIECQAGRNQAFDKKVHTIRPHKGQLTTARNIRNFMKGSELFGIDPTKIGGKKNSPQDSYSLRCIPQVHGASKNALYHIEEVLLIEANSVTDNPLIFVDEDQVISAGNFHGQPLALTMDYLKIAIAELGNISERRSAKLVDIYHNEGLPAFLEGNTTEPGLHSGFMIPQYVAASLVSENKVLCHPASCDSIPTSANIEDHVSMGTIAARQVYDIINNVYHILAIELLLSIQAIDLRQKNHGPFILGSGTQYIYNQFRKEVSFMEFDRYIAPDIEKANNFLKELNINEISKLLNIII